MDRNTQQDEKFQNSALLTNNRARLWSSVIIDALIKGGVQHFYVSPGMRNAPLIAALNLRTKEIELEMVIDERAAAYRALGASKVSGKTSCLICTSGTAVTNYLPALIEAKKTHIPLIAISADRPPELTFSDANQTIQQDRIFIGAGIESHNLQAPNDQVSLRAIVGEVLHILSKSKWPKMGPVHLNVPFREPLDHNSENVDQRQITEAREIMNLTRPIVESGFPGFSLAPEEESYLKDTLSSAKNPLLVVGGLSPFQVGESLKNWIINFKGAKVLDVTSSLKYLFPLSRGGVPTIEHEEIETYLSSNSPDLIIQLGGRLTSKFYYNYLAKNPNIPLIVANAGMEREDPSFRVSYRYHGSPESFTKDLLTVVNESNPKDLAHFSEVIAKKEEIIDSSAASYPVLSKTLIEIIPDKSALYLGNSTVIRSFDSYSSAHLSKDLLVLTNRGVSGIEGLIASAVGARDILPTETPLTLVNGDVATLHDLNSLFMLSSHQKQIILIIANNSCGGIFSLLPVAKEAEVAERIKTPIEVNYKAAEEFFKIPVHRATSKNELISLYQEILATKKSAVIDFVFSDEDNTNVYAQLKTVR